MTEKMHECHACFVVLREDQVERGEIVWHDGTSSAETYVCKDRDGCNVRRHERHIAKLGSATVIGK